MIRYLIPVLLFAALAVLLFTGLGKDPRVIPSALIDRPVPEFSLPELRDPQQQVSHQDHLGDVHMVSVWASWCPSCRVQHPALHELAREHGLPLVGLNYKDEPGEALRWLNQFGDPYQSIAYDPDGRVAMDFGVYGAPETFVVDAQGKIRYKHIGPIDRATIDDTLRPMIAELRAERVDGP